MKEFLKIIFCLNVMFASSMLYSQSQTIRVPKNSGFTAVNITEYNAEFFGIRGAFRTFNRTRGVVVIDVRPNSVAESAGLLIGDLIISIDNERIRDVEEVNRYFRTLSPDAEITYEIRRFKSQDEAMSAHSNLQEYWTSRMSDVRLQDTVRLGRNEMRGLTVEAAPPSSRPDRVIVTSIAPGSPAALVPLDRRLYVGDEIYRVNYHDSFTTPSEFWNFVAREVSDWPGNPYLSIFQVFRLASQEDIRQAEIEAQEQARQAEIERQEQERQARRAEEARQAERRRQESIRNAKQVSCSTLVDGLNANEARVYLEYPTDQPLRLIDTVREIDVNLGTPTVRFRAPNDNWNGCTATMSMQDAASLNIGQRVDLYCTRWSETNGNANFTRCTVLSN